MATAKHALRRSLPVWPSSAPCLRASGTLAGALMLMVVALCPAHAQSVSRLQCEGSLFGAPAVIDGIRRYAAYNALGDGQVEFNGTVAAQGMTGTIIYGGYTATGAFEGIMNGPLGSMRIGVLDNTGGRMLIYNGQASLGAPDTIGQFICSWG
jgi:hypothetical protein